MGASGSIRGGCIIKPYVSYKCACNIVLVGVKPVLGDPDPWTEARVSAQQSGVLGELEWVTNTNWDYSIVIVQHALVMHQ